MLCATFEGHFRTQIIKMRPPNPASLSPGNSVVEPRNLLMSPQVILMLTKVRRNELRDRQGCLLEQESHVLTGVPQPGKGPSTQQDPWQYVLKQRINAYGKVLNDMALLSILCDWENNTLYTITPVTMLTLLNCWLHSDPNV